MRKTLALIAALVVGTATLYAEPVTPGKAHDVAVRFWNKHRPAHVKPLNAMAGRVPMPAFPHLYAFSAGETGFVLVSADDRVRPVLAYSFDDKFSENVNRELAYWLRGYEGQIAAAVEADMAASDVVVQEWSDLQADADTIVSIQHVPALMTTRWDQGEPFNDRCPYDSAFSDRAVVGCVATAMAQIMKYWNYPTFGTSSHTYSHYRYGDLSADFENTTYLWDYMPDMLDRFSPIMNRKAVSTLSYHCGVAVEMWYDISAHGGSGAQSVCYPNWGITHCATSAFSDYFKYSVDITHRYRDGFHDTSWASMLDAELAGGRPMYYSGYDDDGGHAFVLDGSDIQRRYHFNWGWSGYGNGYYTMDNLAPGVNSGIGGNATYTFNQNQGAIFGIEPGVVEQFDTVDYLYSVCVGSRYAYFREYTLMVNNVLNQDFILLKHLDTVFRYSLKQVPRNIVFVDPGRAPGFGYTETYCFTDGFVLPECTFSKANHRFIGWCRHSDGVSSGLLQPGERIMITDDATFYAIWESTLAGIDDADTDVEFSLAPNPVGDRMTVTYGGSASATLTLLDPLGRTVLAEKLSHGETQISLATLPAGVYIVRVDNGAGVCNQRIIKQ